MTRLFVLLLASLALSAQSGEDLKRKYGDPVSETFQVRPGVGVTIRKAKDGTVTEMLITPLNATSLIASRHMTFTQAAAKSVLDDLLPSSARGKFIIGTFLDVTCLPENDCGGSSEDYENVKITYNSARTAGQVRYVDVQFKK
jgi:hypothetical protein